MRYIKEHKKLSIIVLCSLVVFVLFAATFGRYIYNIIDNYILETKGFYFNSSVLSINTKEYKINNWDGVNNYSINVDLNNMKNSLVHTETDIEYNLNVTCSTDVSCNASKYMGVLRENVGTDSFTVTMTPNQGTKFEAGDEVYIDVEVISKSPYKKTLKGKFIISVENNSFSYEIVDAKNDNFMTLSLTNSVPFYEVEQAFSNYKIGDVISLDDYEKLSETEKANCFSAKVTISFDPAVVFLDMTANSYLHRVSGSVEKVQINNFDYVKGYQFKIDATSSEKIIFYKADRTQNFTYPIVNDTSIIEVDVELAE